MRYLIIFIFLMANAFSTIAFANEFNSSLGDLAGSMMEPVSILGQLVTSGSIIIGAAFIFSSIIRYMQYRKNHMATTLSTVILLLLMGIMLVCLPLVYKITGTPLPF